MSHNYSPWEVDVGEFPESGSDEDQLKFLLRFAILAPSGHNSQPWKFHVKDNVVSFRVNQERLLSQSDPQRRQLLITMGCALENVFVAADYYGFISSVVYFPSAGDQNLIVAVSLRRAEPVSGDSKHLIFSIPERRTNRGKYTHRAPPLDFLEKIKNVSPADIEAAFVIDKSAKEKIADIACDAQVEAMEDVLFREELSHYIKSSFTKAKTGMPGFALGIPAPISLIASRLIKKVNLSVKTKDTDLALLKNFTPTFLIISSREDNRKSWIEAGEIFERIWLTAEREGMSLGPLAAIVQTGEYYKKLQEILGTQFRPQVFARIGYAERRVRHSPRLGLSEVIL